MEAELFPTYVISSCQIKDVIYKPAIISAEYLRETIN
jgi:hypothetical protein